jgi:hypothetical protein
MLEEVGELELDDELPEGKLQESEDVVSKKTCMNEWKWCPGCYWYKLNAHKKYKYPKAHR